jgi:hypothetical protein
VGAVAVILLVLVAAAALGLSLFRFLRAEDRRARGERAYLERRDLAEIAPAADELQAPRRDHDAVN